ncbi:AsmA family protein [Robertkochia marina]|uniref:AsmA family protein n=1 Tax=Robertkochia marina TaxID=1227945 RepID=A0A4S3M2S2_9FLAO|nr:AsmA-like C-terminal region-containing protein [Robertkochia marina]THD69170.1 AsmA family protein [Robertkochia marina]TRZ47572.1 AsmA family protein [Robertkochia marina]
MEEKTENNKNKKLPKIFTGWVRGSAIGLLLIVLFMVVFPRVIKRTIENKALNAINSSLVHPIEFSDASLTFFRHFPDMTLSFHDLKIKGSNENFEENFAEIESFTLKVNWLAALLAGNIEINGIIIEKPLVNFLVDENGIPNYNIVRKKKSSKTVKRDVEDNFEKENMSLKVKLFAIDDGEVYVSDFYRDIDIHLAGVKYRGRGQSQGNELVIQSQTTLNEVDLMVKGFAYFSDNQLRSEHLTIFKEDEVTLLLQKNEGYFNELKFNFRGELNFLANGFGIDLDLNTDAPDLGTFFTSLPAPVSNWYREKGVDVQGEAAFSMQIKGMSIKEENLQPDLECRLQWSNGSLTPAKVKEPIKDILLDLKLKVPKFDLQKAQVMLDTINLRRRDYYLQGHVFLEKDSLETYVKGDINTQMNLEELTEALALDSISLKGDFYSKIHMEGVYDTLQGKYPRVNGELRIRNGELLTQYYPKPIEDIEVIMDFYHDGADPKSAMLKLSPAKFRFEDEDFTVNANFNDLTDLKFEVNGKGVLHPGRLYKVFGRDNLELNGIAKMDMRLKGSQKAIERRDFKNFESSGSFELENIQLESAFLEYPITLHQGTFSFDKGTLQFNRFEGTYARTNFNMNGELRYFIRHFLYKDERVLGRFAFAADQVHMDDLIVKSEDVLDERKGKSKMLREANLGDSLRVGVLQIPDFVDVTFDFKTDHLYWDDLHISQLSGLMALAEGGLFAKDIKMNMVGAEIRMDGVYKDFGADRAFFEYDIRVQEFDIQRAYQEIELFQKMAPGAKNASGVVGLNYRLTGILDKDMKLIYPTLEGGGVLSLNNVRVKNHDILSEISEKTGNKEWKDAELQEIEIRSRIAHNVMDVERFKFRVRPFRLRFEGQTSLDNQVNLKMRLGLPPLGIIGIPIKITGSKPDLTIRLGKKTKKLDETFYDEDGIKDIRLAKYAAFRDSLTAGMSIGEVQRMKEKIKNTPAEAFRPPGHNVPKTIQKDIP